MYAWISIVTMLTLMVATMVIVVWARGGDAPAARTETGHRMRAGLPLVLLGALTGVTGTPGDARAQNVVTHWAGIIGPAIHSASAPRPPASAEVLHALVQLAMYDAVIAIEGGYAPYARPIAAAPGADVRAAVATAAYRAAPKTAMPTPRWRQT